MVLSNEGFMASLDSVKWHLALLAYSLHENACFSSGFRLSRGPPHFGLKTICLPGRKLGNPSTLILLTGRSGFVDFLLKELAPQRGGPCIVFSNQGFMASIDSRFSLSWGPPISGSETICPIDRKFGNPSTLILLTGGSSALP